MMPNVMFLFDRAIYSRTEVVNSEHSHWYHIFTHMKQMPQQHVKHIPAHPIKAIFAE